MTELDFETRRAVRRCAPPCADAPQSSLLWQTSALRAAHLDVERRYWRTESGTNTTRISTTQSIV